MTRAHLKSAKMQDPLSFIFFRLERMNSENFLLNRIFSTFPFSTFSLNILEIVRFDRGSKSFCVSEVWGFKLLKVPSIFFAFQKRFSQILLSLLELTWHCKEINFLEWNRRLKVTLLKITLLWIILLNWFYYKWHCKRWHCQNWICYNWHLLQLDFPNC